MQKRSYQRIDVFKKFYPLIKNSRNLYILLSVLKAVTLLLSLVAPFLYMLLVNNVMTYGNLKLLPWIIAGYIGLFLFQTVISVANKAVYNKFFMKLKLKIKTALLFTYTKMDINAYSTYDIGDLKTRTDNDVDVVEKFFNTHVLDYFFAIISAIVIACILIIMNPVLAVTSFIMVPLSFWFSKFMGKKAQILNEEQRKIYGEYESFLH